MRRVNDEAGAIAVLAAVLATTLFGVAALVVDFGYARQARRVAQDSADAAALAGAGSLTGGPNYSPAMQAIRDSAAENFGDGSFADCEATAPSVSRIDWDDGATSGTTCVQFGVENGQTNATMVFVAMPVQHVAPLFGGVFQSTGVDVGGQAVAGRRTTVATRCGICVFGPLVASPQSTVRLQGGASLSAVDGDVAGAVTLSTVDVDVTDDPDAKITFENEPVPVAGPRAYSPDPPLWPWTVVPAAGIATDPDIDPEPRSDTVCDGSGDDLEPGTYGSLSVPAGAVCRLRDGVFTFTGVLTVAAGGRLTTDKAEIVIDGSGDLANEGTMNLDGEDESFALYWQSASTLRLAGTSVSVVGDVWARNSGVLVTSPAVDIDGRLVAGSLTTDFLANLSVTADGSRVLVRSDLGLVR
jgi:Flp pilus assembly protein TadG